jgi:hypothetical protein
MLSPDTERRLRFELTEEVRARLAMDVGEGDGGGDESVGLLLDGAFGLDTGVLREEAVAASSVVDELLLGGLTLFVTLVPWRLAGGGGGGVF